VPAVEHLGVFTIATIIANKQTELFFPTPPFQKCTRKSWLGLRQV